MKSLNLNIKKEKGPLYLKIATSIRNLIKTGLLKSDEKLPSAQSLAQELNCHRHTVLSAYSELLAEGWIVGAERQVYRIASDLSDSFFQSVSGHESSKKSEIKHRLVKEIKFNKKEVGKHIKYPFVSGMPDLRLFPKEQLRACLNDSIKKANHDLLGYGQPYGHDSLIVEIKEYLRRIRNISGREILVTNGSQEGIFIVAQLLLRPGDTVLVEELGYPPAWEALKSSGAQLVPIPIDENGIVVSELKKILKRKKARLIYTTPLHQYPTTVTLPVPRRLELYDLASQYGIPILEDDYDHEFHYRSQPLAPLASNDPNGLIIYISTFSKVFYPSARCGFMALPDQLFKPFSDLKRIISRQNDAIIQDAIARWMRDGGFERHMRKMRRVYEERRNTMIKALEDLDVEYHIPDGGMALWLNTKVNSTKLSELADINGVYVTPESYFSLGSKKAGKHIRIGFANQTSREIEEGLKILLKIKKDNF